MATKEYFIFTKDLGLKPHHQIVQCHIRDIRWVGSYPPAEMLSVYSTVPADWAKSIIIAVWKSDHSDKIKRVFFQAVAGSVLLNGCTTWTLKKQLRKWLYVNTTRMLCAVFNTSSKTHSTKELLHRYLLPISQAIQVNPVSTSTVVWSRMSLKAFILRRFQF